MISFTPEAAVPTESPTGTRRPLLTLEGVGRRFGLRRVVDDVTLVVSSGSFLAVVGENGSGKSTLLRMIAGLLRPTDGTVVRAPESRRVLLLPSGGSLIPKLDAWQTAEFLGGVEHPRSSSRVEDAFARFGVEQFADRPVGQLSLGMRQRLAFATASLVDPDVLLLDEPFHGLDTAGAAEARALLGELAQGRAVVHAAHELLDVLGMADAVLVLERGVARRLDIDDAVRALATELVVEPLARAEKIVTALGATTTVVGPRRLRVGPGHAARDLVAALVAGGCAVDAVTPVLAPGHAS